MALARVLRVDCILLVGLSPGAVAPTHSDRGVGIRWSQLRVLLVPLSAVVLALGNGTAMLGVNCWLLARLRSGVLSLLCSLVSNGVTRAASSLCRHKQLLVDAGLVLGVVVALRWSLYAGASCLQGLGRRLCLDLKASLLLGWAVAVRSGCVGAELVLLVAQVLHGVFLGVEVLLGLVVCHVGSRMQLRLARCTYSVAVSVLSHIVHLQVPLRCLPWLTTLIVLLLALLAPAGALGLLKHRLNTRNVLFAVAMAEEHVDPLLVLETGRVALSTRHARLAHEAVDSLLNFGTWNQHVLEVLGAGLQGSAVLTEYALAAKSLVGSTLGGVKDRVVVLFVPRELRLGLRCLCAVSLDRDVMTSHVSFRYVFWSDCSLNRIVLISCNLLVVD